MTASKIEWTDRSDWNPVRGCTRVSPGCGGPGKHGGCYAEAMAARFSLPGMWGHTFAEMVDGQPRWTGKVELQTDRLLMPLSWKKPAKVFPNSTSDFFHEALSDDEITRLLAVMAMSSRLTFQVLTKRPERMREYFAHKDRINSINGAIWSLLGTPRGSKIEHGGNWRTHLPIPNVWLGTSVERQDEANPRIVDLLNTPAAIRFVSCEPLLGEVDLTRICVQPQRPGSIRAGIHVNALAGRYCESGVRYTGDWDISGPAPGPETPALKIDWVIAGGESGPRARPMHPDWARSLRDQCAAAGVPFFFKQWGEYLPVGQSLPGCGKVHGGTAVKPGRMKLHYGGTRMHAPKHAFAERGVKLASTADGRLTFRVGKSHAGALLDGREHKAFPEVHV